MSSLASIQTQWETRTSPGTFHLSWNAFFTDAETFQRQFREFVSNEQYRLEDVYNLSFEDCPLNGMTMELQILIQRLPALESLKLGYCQMTADDFRRATTAIKPNSLQVLSVYIANPSLNILHEVVNFVSTQTALEELVFWASPESLEITRELLITLRGLHNLVKLRLLGTSYIEDLLIDYGFVEALCDVLRNCVLLSIVDIVLGNYTLEDEWANLLLATVSEHEYIRTFSFNHDADIFWDELRTSAETQLRNVLRSSYDNEYTMEITKLVFIGDGAVGKSSTMRTLLGEDFFAAYDPTLVLDLNSFVTLNHYDLSLQKVYSNDYARFHYKFNLAKLLNAQKEPVSKLELQDSRLSFEFEQEAVEEVVRDDYFQDLLKTGESPPADDEHLMQVFDFGGQEVFYSLHHLLLTNSGIHVLVFNMEETDNSNMERVRFWMESVLLNAPNSMVIIVGTHFESFRLQSASSGTNLDDLLKAVNQKIEETHYGSSGRLQIIRNGRLSFFPLANSDEPGSAEAESIINGIARAVSGASGFDPETLTMGITVAEHMYMSNLLQNAKYMLRDEFFERADEAGFAEEEVHEMLEKYTRVELVLYLPDLLSKRRTAKDIVVLSPKWLISAFSKIVFNKFSQYLDRVVPTELRRDNDIYLKTGVISKELLGFFWAEYMNEKEFLLECSLKTLILVRFSYGGKEEYLVPAMMPKDPIDNVGMPLNIPTEFHCAVYFKKYMPLGFFPRIVAVFAEIAACSESSSIPILSGSFCRIIIEPRFVICLAVNYTNNLVSIRLEREETKLSELLTLTEKVIEKVKNSVHDIKLEVEGLALAKKLPQEDRQPMVKITDVKNHGKRQFFLDYINHARVQTQRFSNFEVPPGGMLKEHFDLFLSHAWGAQGETHREVEWIERLFAEQGLKSCIDERHIRGNLDFKVRHGLISSSAYVLFLTDSFLARLENQNNNLTNEFFMIRESKNRGDPVFLVALESHLREKENWPPYSLLSFNFMEEEVFDLSTEEAFEHNFGAFMDAVLLRQVE